MPIFIKSVVIAAPVEVVFGFHERDDALRILSPKFPPMKVVRKTGGIEKGAQVELEIQPFPGVKIHWVALHTAFEKNRLFEDQQISGPFAKWIHRHEFAAIDAATSRVTDHVDYLLPGGKWVNAVLGPVVKLGLMQMFRHRHRITRLVCTSSL